jgi:hypothetical protein
MFRLSRWKSRFWQEHKGSTPVSMEYAVMLFDISMLLFYNDEWELDVVGRGGEGGCSWQWMRWEDEHDQAVLQRPVQQ